MPEQSDQSGKPDRSDHTDHFAPEGLRTRGTVVVVPGRGETRATYDRFGSRLAADAYRVRVVDAPAVDMRRPARHPLRFAARLTAAVDGARGEDGTVRPVVVVGSDTGAALVAALYGTAGASVAGCPGGGGGRPGGPPRPGARRRGHLGRRTRRPHLVPGPPARPHRRRRGAPGRAERRRARGAARRGP